MLRLAVAVVVLALLGGAAVRAEGPAPAVIIVDSSGSMAAREPDGRAKLDAARATIVDTLQRWPAGGEVALMAYGHRRKGDCADIEVIRPMGPVDAAATARDLDRLRARGKTPISASLQQAADLLGEGGGTILLVSDGLETCAADPCLAASALAQANGRLIIDVIGFAVEEKETSQLSCIAAAARGSYFGAADAAALAVALGEVAAAVETSGQEPPPAPPPEVKPPPEPTSPIKPPPPAPRPVVLTAVAGALGEIVDLPVGWRLVSDAGEVVYEGESRELSLTLPIGGYRVEAFAANAAGGGPIEVAAGEVTQVFQVQIEAGRLNLTLAANAVSEPFSEGEAAGIAWLVTPLDGQLPVTVPPIARPSLLLAPGRYQVEVQLQGHRTAATVSIAVGAPTEAALHLKLGTVVLEAALGEEGPALDDAGQIEWRIGGGEAVRTIQGQARPRVTLPAGSYPLTLVIAGSEVHTTLEIADGQDRTRRVLVPGGTLSLSARLGPQSAPFEDWRDASWTVEAVAALGVAPGSLAAEQMPSATLELPLAAGRWRVTVDSGKARATREVQITPDQETAVTLDMEAGRLTARAHPAAGPPPRNIVFSFYQLDPAGTPAEQPAYEAGVPEDIAIVLPAGRWRVVALDEQGRQDQADLVLAPGEEVVATMTLK